MGGGRVPPQQPGTAGEQRHPRQQVTGRTTNIALCASNEGPPLCAEVGWALIMAPAMQE